MIAKLQLLQSAVCRRYDDSHRRLSKVEKDLWITQRRRSQSALALLFLLGGCAAPISTQKLTLTESYRQLNRSALSGLTLSDATLIVLRRHDLMTTWETNPEAAVSALRTAVVGQSDSWSDLFALAELSYLEGKRHDSPADFLAAAVYAYAFLSPGDASVDRPSPYDERFRQACDIYNLSLTSAFAKVDGSSMQIGSRTRVLPFGSISLTADPIQLQWGGRQLVGFQPTANIAVNGLQNIYRSPGLGAPLAALPGPSSDSAKDFQIAPRLRVPTNMVLVLDAPRSQVAQTALQGRLVLNTNLDQLDMQLGKEDVPLEYEETATRAISLVEAADWSNEYKGFLNGRLFNRGQPQLVALEPHQPGHMPVILIHGTASSSFRWSDMVNDLSEIPAIRDHFEFWAFTYPTGNPIPFSALQLRKSIEQAVSALGGVQSDPALGRMTLIGHSQGGLLAKMLVIDPGNQMWDRMVRRPLSSLTLTKKSRQLIQDMLFPKPLPEVQRVVFIATPQRGSYVAAFSISQMIGRLVTLPLAISDAGKEIITGNSGNLIIGQRRLRIGAVYGMSPGSPFIKSLAATPVVPNVRAHSIIAVSTSGPFLEGNDGVVQYKSAHITPVDSELIVRSTHSAQSNPATIAEVNRILMLQLASSEAKGSGTSTVMARPGRDISQ
jgi:pimeloyl-ACP methyl ester carboxylesterase